MSDDIMDTDFEPGKTGTFYNPMARPAERTLEERQADEHLNVLEKIVDRLDQQPKKMGALCIGRSISRLAVMKASPATVMPRRNPPSA